MSQYFCFRHFIYALLFLFSQSWATCYWRSLNNVGTPTGWFPCPNTEKSPGGAELCCLNGAQCGEDSICHIQSSGGGSGWFVGGCTDGNYADPVCRTSCSKFHLIARFYPQLYMARLTLIAPQSGWRPNLDPVQQHWRTMALLWQQWLHWNSNIWNLPSRRTVAMVCAALHVDDPIFLDHTYDNNSFLLPKPLVYRERGFKYRRQGWNRRYCCHCWGCYNSGVSISWFMEESTLSTSKDVVWNGWTAATSTARRWNVSWWVYQTTLFTANAYFPSVWDGVCWT